MRLSYFKPTGVIYKSEAVGNEDECATISVYLLENVFFFFFFSPTVTAQCVPFLNAP